MLLAQSGFIACYVVIAVLLVLMLLYSHWPWAVKLFMVFVVFCFNLLSYFSFTPLLGWPTTDKLPERFKLVSEMVKEPNKVKGTNGEIYLWITDIESTPETVKPRAYKIPYSKEMHEWVIEAGNKVRKGMPQVGEVNEGNFGMTTASDTYYGGDEVISIKFFDLPEPALPDK